MADKYKIKGVKRNLNLCEASAIINKNRYKTVLKRAKRYLNNSTKENLHELRISIRRLRYSLENFRVCYSKNEFLIVIGYIKFLQDLIGEVRDLDVLPEKIKQLEQENQIPVSQHLYKEIEVQKERTRPKIYRELGKFLNNRTIVDFFVSKERRKL